MRENPILRIKAPIGDKLRGPGLVPHHVADSGLVTAWSWPPGGGFLGLGLRVYGSSIHGRQV